MQISVRMQMVGFNEMQKAIERQYAKFERLV